MEELNVFNWPGLEKRVEDFEQAAGEGELKMVYVKEGSGVVREGEQSAMVRAGQVVMISDGTVSWGGIGDEGLLLISTSTTLDDDEPDAVAKDEPEDLSLKEAAVMLGAGFAFGAVVVLGAGLVGAF
mmetsp:Transcript_20994/g.40859  ORF Transcript_20994/g.40859 Transcript_20994/m.40859 type:complete len:127 (-) Transcript_20994:373-753(-)